MALCVVSESWLVEIHLDAWKIFWRHTIVYFGLVLLVLTAVYAPVIS